MSSFQLQKTFTAAFRRENQRQPKQWRRDSDCRMRAVAMFLKSILQSKATYGTDNQHINVTSGENVEAPLNRRAALGALAGSSTQLLNRNHSSARWPAWSPPVLTALAAARQPAARKTHQHFITELWLKKKHTLSTLFRGATIGEIFISRLRGASVNNKAFGFTFKKRGTCWRCVVPQVVESEVSQQHLWCEMFCIKQKQNCCFYFTKETKGRREQNRDRSWRDDTCHRTWCKEKHPELNFNLLCSLFNKHKFILILMFRVLLYLLI